MSAPVFSRGDFVREPGGKIALVIAVEKHRKPGGRISMDRLTLQYVDGSTLSNAPSYYLSHATEAEIKATLGEALAE